jgi:hypothetical protein
MGDGLLRNNQPDRVTRYPEIALRQNSTPLTVHVRPRLAPFALNPVHLHFLPHIFLGTASG